MPTPDAPVSLGTLALTKDGSRRKKVKDTGKLAKMADVNTPWEGLDMRSHRKFQAEHLNGGGLNGSRREPTTKRRGLE